MNTRKNKQAFGTALNTLLKIAAAAIFLIVVLLIYSQYADSTEEVMKFSIKKIFG